MRGSDGKRFDARAPLVAQVAASIIEFGWRNPILAGADGVIIAGHARLAAARAGLGFS